MKPWAGRRSDVPVKAHSRPVLDDRRPGGLWGLLGQASVTIDQGLALAVELEKHPVRDVRQVEVSLNIDGHQMRNKSKSTRILDGGDRA